MLLRSHIDRTNQNRVVKMDTAGGMDWQAKRLDTCPFSFQLIVLYLHR